MIGQGWFVPDIFPTAIAHQTPGIKKDEKT